jgi:hypothetical protein
LRGAKEAGQMLAAQSDEKMKTKDSKDLNNYPKLKINVVMTFTKKERKL